MSPSDDAPESPRQPAAAEPDSDSPSEPQPADPSRPGDTLDPRPTVAAPQAPTAEDEALLADVSLRPETEADMPFLSALYASTRAEELQQVPWSDEQKREFLAWQFDSQHKHYLEHYPDCDFQVIERGGEPVGRLYLDEWDEELRLVDVALVPEVRGEGLGGALLRRILERGRRAGKAVSIHVEYNNPALRLYRRLGFQHVDSNGVYYLMRWEPPAEP